MFLDPGNVQTSNNASVEPAGTGLRASFDGSLVRSVPTEHSVAAATSDPEIAVNATVMARPPVFGSQPPNPMESSMFYPTQNALIRSAVRPPSAVSMSSLTAAMSGMNLSNSTPPPTPGHHNPHSIQAASQYFPQIQATPQQLAATLAAITQRNPAFSFTTPFPQTSFQPRSATPNSHQQPMFYQQQQNRRITPPPPPPVSIPVPPSHSHAASNNNLAANIMGHFQGASMYSFQNVQEFNQSVPFTPTFPPQTYDAWLSTEAANTALANGGLYHLQYPSAVMPPAQVMAWPSQSQPGHIRNPTSSQHFPVHFQQHQAQTLPYFLTNMIGQVSSANFVAPPAQPNSSVTTPMVTTTTSINTASAAVNVDSLDQSTDTSTFSTTTSATVVSTQSSITKEDPQLLAVSEASSVEVVNRRTGSLPQQAHSRPTSSASGKTKYKSGKGGHHPRSAAATSTHSNRAAQNTSASLNKDVKSE